MKHNAFPCILVLCVLTALVSLPNQSRGGSEVESPASVLADVVEQQKALTENQTKIETKMAEIAEDLRLARIFVSRSGSGKRP